MRDDTLTILATADLHYNIRRSREPTEQLARRVCATDADVLVLVGDTAGADLRAMRDCLALFDRFDGLKLLVPGNHCLWCVGGEDSLTRYHTTLPNVCEAMGFAVLDHAPHVVKGVGLVGSIGWYDYSFRDESLGIPLPFYRAKVAPGAAGYFTEHRELMDQHAESLSADHLAITARWMDGVHVRLPLTDEQFTQWLADRLADQLATTAARAERIVVFTHHVPFAYPRPADAPSKFAFAAAFMGSRRLGAVIAAEPKVTHALCGHSHRRHRQRVGSLEVVNIGCTYTHKRLEVLTVPRGGEGEAASESGHRQWRREEGRGSMPPELTPQE